MNLSGLPWYLRDPGYKNYGDPLADDYTLDFETTNLGKGDARIPGNSLVLASLKAGSGPIGTTAGHRNIVDRLGCLDVLGAPCVLVAHNAKFELSWMNREHINTKHMLVWDTMVAEYVIAGNRRVPLDLGSVARRYGFKGKDPVVDGLITGGVCPSDIPEQWLIERCERDVETTYQIYRAQREYFDQRPALAEVFFTRCIVTPVLAKIEAEGMKLDAKRVYAEYDKQIHERATVGAKLQELVGDVNMRSPKQVAALLYDTLKFRELERNGSPMRTPSGGRLTDGDSLAKLKATTPQQRKFIDLRAEYSEADSLVTKNLSFFNAVCEQYDGIFYGNFNQTRTQTHRLSSSGRKILFKDGTEKGVQFQNLPREYKSLFTTRDPDYLMVECDGAQLEFRVAAYLGRDKVACQDIVDEEDIHRFTASILHRIPEDQVTKDQRTHAKPDTFKPLYGGTSGTPRQMDYYKAFREKYNAVYRTQEKWVAEVLRDKKLVTPWGFVFYWPEARMDRSGYVNVKANVYNYPIQSFATADIIPVSMVYAYWKAKAAGIRFRLINTVHDSIVTEVHKEDIDAYRGIVVDSFLPVTYRYLELVYGIEMDVPLGVGFTAGTHWGEGEEQKFSQPYKRIMTDG